MARELTAEEQVAYWHRRLAAAQAREHPDPEQVRTLREHVDWWWRRCPWIRSPYLPPKSPSGLAPIHWRAA